MTWAIAAFSPNLLQDAGEMLRYDFMRTAFSAGGCIAVAAGLTGYFVLLRNQVFATDALGHTAFTGGLGGLLAGVALLPAVFVSAVLGALAIGSLGGRGRGRDVAVGTVFAWVLGLGVLFLSLYTSSRSASSGTVGITVLFGSILNLEPHQAMAAEVAGLGASAVLLLIGRRLLFVSIDPDVAAARGVGVRALSLGFLVLVGVTVAEAVQAVGALLIFGLMVTPAAVAQRLSASPFRAMAISAGASLLVTWTGIALAYYLPFPPSFLVIACASLVYLVVETAAGRHRVWKNLAP